MILFIRALLLVATINLSLGTAVSIAKEQDVVRNNIIEFATSYLDRGYKYNQRIVVKHPYSEEDREFRFDCSGFVSAVYWSADIDVFKKELLRAQMSTTGIHTVLKKSNKIYKSKPQKGDVIFFNRTTKRETPLSHIGIVIDTDTSGITTFIHMSNSGIKKGYINLVKPNDYISGGVVLNSYVRGGVGTRGLASKCFDSYGAIFSKP